MAAPVLLLLLLVASGGAVVGDDGAALPHLELRGIQHYSGRGHASDAPPLPQGLMGYLNFTPGCESFAALLLATTANAGEIFREHLVAGGGLTVFCPDDLSVAAFEPKLNNLSADDQLAVLLHHVAAARYAREQFAAFEWVALRTLAVDAATNKSLALIVSDTVWLSGSGGAARVTKAISSYESPIAVYVVDAVLLPSRLRQRLDGGDEAVVACTPWGAGGYLGLLHCTVPIWVALCMAGSSMVGILSGLFIGSYAAASWLH